MTSPYSWSPTDDQLMEMFMYPQWIYYCFRGVLHYVPLIPNTVSQIIRSNRNIWKWFCFMGILCKNKNSSETITYKWQHINWKGHELFQVPYNLSLDLNIYVICSWEQNWAWHRPWQCPLLLYHSLHRSYVQIQIYTLKTTMLSLLELSPVLNNFLSQIINQSINSTSTICTQVILFYFVLE